MLINWLKQEMKKTNKENPENGAKESLVMSYEEQKHNHRHRDTINNDKKEGNYI